ncbi:MAG: hypothetical protein MZW92_75730 [Comamonadaceae bacterium]|nr:hypothetical protein [Comamonadaceae bacterium]
MVGDVNIHEVLRARARADRWPSSRAGSTIERDYDTSHARVPRRPRAAHPGACSTSCATPRRRWPSASPRATRRSCCARASRARSRIGTQRYRLALELHVERQRARACPRRSADRIFYPLVSGREGGTGLGLTLAQTFVQQHHGTDRVRQPCRAAPSSRS